MTQITKSGGVTQAVIDWADANGYVADRYKTEGSIHLVKGDIGFEFIAADGFAYIHGEGSLNGKGTTIMDLDDLETAIAMLIETLG